MEGSRLTSILKTLMPKLVDALRILMIGLSTRVRVLTIGDKLDTTFSGLLTATRLGINSLKTIEK